jgi:hypothetical protein
MVTRHWLFAGNLTYSCHNASFFGIAKVKQSAETAKCILKKQKKRTPFLKPDSTPEISSILKSNHPWLENYGHR